MKINHKITSEILQSIFFRFQHLFCPKWIKSISP